MDQAALDAAAPRAQLIGSGSILCEVIKAAELLEFAQLAERAGSRVEPLSGGMKRRLSVALALLGSPQVARQLLHWLKSDHQEQSPAGEHDPQ